MGTILEIKHLHKSFEGLSLFDDASWQVPKGVISVLLGKNGSGKTTLFNMLTGYLKPDAGTVAFEGSPINKISPDGVARLGIGKMWQSPRTMLFLNHSVLDNLMVAAPKHKGDGLLNNFFSYKAVKQQEANIKQKALDLLEELGLEQYTQQPAGTLSLGNQKLVCLGMLLMSEARLLLLDEPFSSIHPDTIQKISGVLLKQKQAGKSILMIEHKINFARQISDYLFEIQNQKIKAV
ncbi:ATP-binding cassette domain-containing protein [Emticicia sp. W12TSBA100-4]|uniref:ABC transporter ATP-binding protein n=1 Tax=Emticicia sp. W12TSBA100-4 TaxID=3160965 RepID=UPI00330674CF